MPALVNFYRSHCRPLTIASGCVISTPVDRSREGASVEGLELEASYMHVLRPHMSQSNPSFLCLRSRSKSWIFQSLQDRFRSGSFLIRRPFVRMLQLVSSVRDPALVTIKSGSPHFTTYWRETLSEKMRLLLPRLTECRIK